MSQMTVLNPELYQALKRRFGDVSVEHRGQVSAWRKMVKRTPRDKEFEIGTGENYKVACPWCGDKSKHLSVSYRWKTVEETATGRVEFGTFPAQCLRRHCKEVHTQLEDELKPYIQRDLILPPPMHESVAVATFNKTELPGRCIPVDHLPVEHKAVQYLFKRGFDPKQLTKEYAVHYCISAPLDYNCRGFVEDRLIVPIYKDGFCVGWQTRYIGDPVPPKIPKYFTMPSYPKGSWLYNMDMAKNYSFGVLVEGATSVWRIGPPAVAAFGKYISLAQQSMMHNHWQALVVLLDPDIYDDKRYMEKLFGGAEKTQEERENPFGRFPKGTIWVKLPDNNDPAECSREYVWECIHKAAQQKGVKLELV